MLFLCAVPDREHSQASSKLLITCSIHACMLYLCDSIHEPFVSKQAQHNRLACIFALLQQCCFQTFEKVCATQSASHARDSKVYEGIRSCCAAKLSLQHYMSACAHMEVSSHCQGCCLNVLIALPCMHVGPHCEIYQHSHSYKPLQLQAGL